MPYLLSKKASGYGVRRIAWKIRRKRSGKQEFEYEEAEKRADHGNHDTVGTSS